MKFAPEARRGTMPKVGPSGWCYRVEGVPADREGGRQVHSTQDEGYRLLRRPMMDALLSHRYGEER